MSSLGAVLGWDTSSWRSWVRRLGDTAGGILCAGVGALRVTLATPEMQFVLWWGRWRSVITALRYVTAFQDTATLGPRGLPPEAGARGVTRVFYTLGGSGSQ